MRLSAIRYVRLRAIDDIMITVADSGSTNRSRVASRIRLCQCRTLDNVARNNAGQPPALLRLAAVIDHKKHRHVCIQTRSERRARG